MVCNTCGRHIQNKEANFCDYCGASFRGDSEIKPSSTYTYQSKGEDTPAPMPPPMPEAINIDNKEKTVPVLEWLGAYLIMFIPFVGGIVFFIMMLIWSFSKTIPTSKRNWARATLIFYIITFILLIFVVLYYIPMLDNPMFKDFLNLDTNELTNILQEYR